MNEIVFIDTNKKSWERLAKIVDGLDKGSISETVELYLQAADDLAYARTHYPESRINTHLNALVLNAHRIIYKNNYGNWSNFKAYWTTEIPLAIYRHRFKMLAAFAVFLVSILIGWFSSSVDSSFVRLILGDSYVNMTLDNIEQGDPMAVYRDMHQSNMFLNIGVNNIRVAFLAFMLGIFTSVGTSLIILFNGVMVGAFFYFFYERGIAALAWSTIMIHGSLELSAIAIAGGAGYVLGHSFLFPGTYTRMHALVRGAADGVKIMIALVPVFIAAAFLESYMTREYLAVTMLTRMMIILASFAFLIWYFIIYSKKVHERINIHPVAAESGIWTNYL
jgi:uncharacterized membrane protein SpoIIM required for sporulation